MTSINSAARSLPIERAGDDRGVPIPRDAPVEPSYSEATRKMLALEQRDVHAGWPDDEIENTEPSWLELARLAFIRRWHEENGDELPRTVS